MTLSNRSLPCRPSSIDGQGVAGHEGGAVGEQKKSGSDDLLILADAMESRFFCEITNECGVTLLDAGIGEWARSDTPFSLAANTALVTGSSRGIGLGLARGLQEAGAKLVFHGHTPRPAEVGAGELYIQSNLVDAPASPAALITEAFKAAPALDLLVCNAGSFFDVPFLEMSSAEWDRTMGLNLRANYFIVQAFAKEMIARKRFGAVVIISSTNGFQPEEDSTAYDTSKGGVVMMTRALAQALAPHNIRVNGLAPGLIYTPLTTPSLQADPKKREYYEKNILLGRIGEPADCAGAAVFLLSQAAAYITGQIIVVDGGLTTGQIGRM